MISKIPFDFIKRRLHSFFGVFLAIFLFQHLFVNSQATFLLGEDGKGFIQGANKIHGLPYLPFIEIFFLAFPFAFHGFYGIAILFGAAPNSNATDGRTPGLPEYGRNKAYTWQRITSWILLVAIALHVGQMRFYRMPEVSEKDGEKTYSLIVTEDEGLFKLASRLKTKIEKVEGGVVLRAPDFGTAELFMLRDTFKSPLMMAFYALFVLSACFHAYNGLWTALITWGITLSEKSRQLALKVCYAFMFLAGFLGIASVFCYFANLRS